jgi:HK97 family phage prohead protease
MSVIKNDKLETRAVTKGEIRTVRAAEGGPITLAGYAAVYDQRSEPIYGSFYEVIKRGAFASALDGTDDVRALFDHDSAMVLGRTKAKTLRLSDDAHGLKVEIDLPDTAMARDLAQSIERGDIDQMSFGFRTIKDEWTWEKTKEGIVVDIRTLVAVELFDVSVVTYPAYSQTEVALRSRDAWRSSKQGRLREAELRLRESEA